MQKRHAYITREICIIATIHAALCVCANFTTARARAKHQVYVCIYIIMIYIGMREFLDIIFEIRKFFVTARDCAQIAAADIIHAKINFIHSYIHLGSERERERGSGMKRWRRSLAICGLELLAFFPTQFSRQNCFGLAEIPRRNRLNKHHHLITRVRCSVYSYIYDIYVYTR